MINNLDKIRSILLFDSDDDFYHLQIIKRKKEHPGLGSNSYVVKAYYITSEKYLLDKFDEIKCLCDFHKARACINLNRRSFEKLALHNLKKVTDCIMNKDYRSVRKSYESVCGAFMNESNKKWIVDVDVKDLKLIHTIIDDIKNIHYMNSDRKFEYYALLETKNGFHIITAPFRLDKFKELYSNVDVHKNNPTILYL